MDTPLEVQIGKYLLAHRWKLAVAESCTGGLIGHRITNVPGSSAYYLGSVTAYAYEAKVQLLGVSWATLERYGAVSGETVLAMARGIRSALNADVGLSVSGIAGPGGGMKNKPVGLTWFGISAPDYENTWRFVWHGDRIANKNQSAEKALELLVEFLMERQMETIEVTARFDKDGLITPLEVVKNGVHYRVESTGRRWQGESGEHILVMIVGNRVMHLLFNFVERKWYFVGGNTQAIT
ncbi:MAG: CinA family protein [Anaerolineales bacterium]|nr:CinA family protein [Anaerolineales bacterium]